MKITINLSNGSTLEKKLITAFSTGVGEYVILDNEAVGSMGLPIILVSKYMNNSLVKITDQNEWEQVKESLKTIISGGNMNYIVLNPTIGGEEVFYTQLTLPEASFNALKLNYKVDVAPAVTEDPIPSIEDIKIEEPVPTPQEEVVETPPTIEPVVPEKPVTPEIEISPTIPPQPVVEPQPIVDPQLEEPAPQPIGPVVNQEVTKNVDEYKEIRDSFMTACENMFDALIIKFENKK